ncbi:MAG: SpoIIE family protein phosphatase [Phycisphaerae bacterium]
MKIRWKLMVLLLVIALVPLLVASAIDRVSTHRLGGALASETREILVEQARRRLELLVADYGRLLDRDRRLLDLALHLQAQAVESRLNQPPPAAPRMLMSEFFDRPSFLGDPNTAEDYFRIGADGARVPMPVTFSQQVFFLAAGVDASAVTDDMARLSTMPEVYRHLHSALRGLIHWQYTALESGVHTSFPGHGGYPGEFDPRKRRWYTQAKEDNALSGRPPSVDVTTRMVMLALSMPVRGPDGAIVGVTGIDVPAGRIFRDLKLPEQWSADEATLLVYPGSGKGGVPEGKLAVIAQRGYHEAIESWQEPLELKLLTSDDPNELEALRLDAAAGNSGVRKMRYRGREALWAYGAIAPRQPFPIVIVRYDRIVAQADEAERYVLDRTVAGLQITGLILLAVVAAVILAALVSSRAVTRPVNQLAEASQRLAAGDYRANVDIRTGDELQALGEAFNDMAPKLAEREKMKRSLELAMEIQQNLLPGESPRLEGFDIAGRSVYCDETGGDYYDFIDLVDLAPGRLGIAVGDVTGHGIAAALLMASARGVLRSHAPRRGADLAELFDELNRHLVRDTCDGRFMTLFYGVLDAPARSLWWTSGGHDPALWLRRAGGNIEELPNTGIPLGVIEDTTYTRAGPVTLESGDIVLIGTDGIWEARGATGEMFGKQRLRELLSAKADLSAEKIHLAVVEAVRDFQAGVPQADDITLVVIKAM